MSGNSSDRSKWLNRTVLAVAAASLFSDVSHEMATAVLPAFLLSVGAGAAALGLIEGAADLISSAAKLYAGAIGDRIRSRRWVCGAGYFATTAATASFAAATSWFHILAGRIGGWLGRGFRSPLRDSLLADDTGSADYGKAFGLERAGDSVGAVIGPLLTAGLLAVGIAVRDLFLMTVIPGLAAALLIVFGVRERARTASGARHRGSTLARIRSLPSAYRRYLVAVGVYGSGDYAKSLLILWAVGESIHPFSPDKITLPILLYAFYNAVSAAASYVFGALSDRFGRKRLLVTGYAAGVAASLAVAAGADIWPLMLAVFSLAGISVGSQEAVEKAVCADQVDRSERSLAFGLLATVNGVGDFASSTLVGLLWAVWGFQAAFAAAAVVCAVGTVLMAAAIPARQAQ
jgi:MFS family permease